MLWWTFEGGVGDMLNNLVDKTLTWVGWPGEHTAEMPAPRPRRAARPDPRCRQRAVHRTVGPRRGHDRRPCEERRCGARGSCTTTSADARRSTLPWSRRLGVLHEDIADPDVRRGGHRAGAPRGRADRGLSSRHRRGLATPAQRAGVLDRTATRRWLRGDATRKAKHEMLASRTRPPHVRASRRSAKAVAATMTADRPTGP